MQPATKKRLVENAKRREQVLVQYADSGNVLSASRRTRATLESGIYTIEETMNGIVFSKAELNSDELIRFEDSRLNEVENEIDLFWSLENGFKEMGLTHKRGVLLYGAPGQGKSCLLRRVAESAVEQDIVVFIGGRSMGCTVQGLREFKEVEPNRKTLVIIEDMDEVCSYNEHAVLELMDGGDQMNGVLILGTTNYPERLPPRILRAGRFDTKLEVKSLPIAGRLAYFSHKLSKIESNNRIQELAEMTDGFSFAQMRELIASAYCYKRPIEDCINRIKRGLSESKTERNETSLSLLMVEKGLKTGYSNPTRWKAAVKKQFGEGISFVRSKVNTDVIVAKVNGNIISRFNETTGKQLTIKDKK